MFSWLLEILSLINCLGLYALISDPAPRLISWGSKDFPKNRPYKIKAFGSVIRLSYINIFRI